MAFSYSPKIVTDGLVLYLDAANPYSYVSGSTTWNDISRSQLSGSLVNGPTFSTGSGGAIVFDGIDDYCSLPPIDTYSSTAQFTIEGLLTLRRGNFGRIFTNGSTTTPGVTGYINFDLLIYTASSKPYLALRVGFTEILNIQISTNNFDDRFPINMYFSITVDKSTRIGTYTFRFNGDFGLIYKEISSTFTSGIATDFVENRLGAETNNESYMKMNMYLFRMYNRVLTTQEIEQNYNATKGRFGIT